MKVNPWCRLPRLLKVGEICSSCCYSLSYNQHSFSRMTEWDHIDVMPHSNAEEVYSWAMCFME